MPARLALLPLLVLAISAFSQVPRSAQQINQRVDAKEQRLNQTETPATTDPAMARLHEIHQDAQQLFALSASVQSDLQLLGKGMLAKDLQANLKKMEKLSKKLRQEMNP
jgi:hypothetical protein